MGKKVFQANLSIDSISKLKQDLLEYKNIELKNKLQRFVKRLAEEGYQVAEERIHQSPVGSNVSVRIETSDFKGGTIAYLKATGGVKEVEGREPFSVLLAIEFGSGIYYNATTNPKADEFGYGPGTYPDQKYALGPDGWYYWDDSSGQWKHTYGIKATMPMYASSEKIRESIDKIALEVFG